MKRKYFIIALFFLNNTLSLLVDLQTNDSEEKLIISLEEETLLEYLQTIEREQEYALSRTINMNEETTLIELFSIKANLEKTQKELVNIEKIYKNARKKYKKFSQNFTSYQNNKQKKIKLLSQSVKEKLKTIENLIIARNLSLNSNYSIKEATEALRLIEKYKEIFYENTVKTIKKRSSALFNYHYDVFYENLAQVIDARNRFKKLLKENQDIISADIKKMNHTFINKYGKNTRLNRLLQEKLAPSITQLAKTTASIQILLDRLEERVKNQESEEK
jgi:hypothetical protein